MMNTTEFQAELRLDVKGQKKAVAQMGAVKRELGLIRNNMSKLAQASQALTMEFLGIMFFGMMLQRVFRGLLGPAMEVFGVMDLWSTMLMVLFLPIIQELFPYFLQMVEYFINLDGATKLLIGGFTVFMTILGVFIMLFGQIGLGVFSIIRFIQFVVPLIQGLGITVSGAFLAVLAIILIVVIGIWLAWKENFGNIRDWFDVIWSGIKQSISGLKNIVSGVMDVVKGILTGDFDLAVEGIKKIWVGFKDWFKGLFKIVIGIVVSVALGLFKIFVNIVDFIAQAWWKLIQKMDEWTGGWVSKFIGWLLDIIIFLNKMLSKLASVAVKLHLPGADALQGGLDMGLGGLTTIRDNINGAGSIQNIEIHQVFNVADKTEMEKMIEDNNKSVVEDLFRLIKTPS